MKQKGKKLKVTDYIAAPAPEFLQVQTVHTYIIQGADDVAIELSAEQLEELATWWATERQKNTTQEHSA